MLGRIRCLKQSSRRRLIVRCLAVSAAAMSAIGLCGCSPDSSSVSLPWAVIDHPSPLVYDVLIYDGGCDTFTQMVAVQALHNIMVSAVGTRRNNTSCTSELHSARARLILTPPQAHQSLVHSPPSSPWNHSTYTREIDRTARCLAHSSIC